MTASVDYGCATFMNTVFGAYKFNLFNGEASGSAFLHGTFFLFLIILALHALVNIAGSHLVAPHQRRSPSGGTSPASR